MIFRVKNPDGYQALIDAPYRVDIIGIDGQTVFTSDGSDKFSVRAGEDRPVVFEAIDRVKGEPKSAKVTTYGITPAPRAVSASLPEQGQFDLTARNSQCEVATGCQTTLDVGWHGLRPVNVSEVTAIVHSGTDTSGAIVAAGKGAGTTPYTSMQPGQTVPFTVGTEGQDTSPAMKVEFYVDGQTQ